MSQGVARVFSTECFPPWKVLSNTLPPSSNLTHPVGHRRYGSHEGSDVQGGYRSHRHRDVTLRQILSSCRSREVSILSKVSPEHHPEISKKVTPHSSNITLQEMVSEAKMCLQCTDTRHKVKFFLIILIRNASSVLHNEQLLSRDFRIACPFQQNQVRLAKCSHLQ